MSDFFIDGLEEAEKALTQMIERDYPEEFKKMVIQIAYELQGKTKELTPVRTSYLQDHWFVGEITKVGKGYYIEVYNNVEYAEPVEHGHRHKGGRGFVKGAHMMQISLAEIEKRLPVYLQTWLSDFLNTHEVF